MSQKDRLQAYLAAGSEKVDSPESCLHHWGHWFYHLLS